MQDGDGNPDLIGTGSTVSSINVRRAYMCPVSVVVDLSKQTHSCFSLELTGSSLSSYIIEFTSVDCWISVGGRMNADCIASLG